MLNVQQNDDGFIHMTRHFPNKTSVAITFSDGSRREFLGARLNELYDEALADFRRGNNLDAKGYHRNAVNIHRHNEVALVPVHPEMAP